MSYYAVIRYTWAGLKGFTTHHTARTIEVDTPEQANAWAWWSIDQYMQDHPEGGYRARYWVCKA